MSELNLLDYKNNSKFSKSIKDLEDKCKIYKKFFDKLEKICNKDPKMPGSISQSNDAISALEKGKDTSGMSEDALNTANSFIEMNKVQKNLLDKGMSLTHILEVSRRILDGDLPESKPLTK